MEIMMKSLNEIVPYENNPRFNDEAVEKVAQSIKEFGFKVPIVIDKNNVIVTGHTRYKASQQLGLSEVPVIVANDLTDKQCKAFRLADNKVSDFSFFDNKKLLEELDGLDDIFTGFTTSDIFDDTLDNIDLPVLEENDTGVTYEVVIRVDSKEEAESIVAKWGGYD